MLVYWSKTLENGGIHVNATHQGDELSSPHSLEKKRAVASDLNLARQYELVSPCESIESVHRLRVTHPEFGRSEVSANWGQLLSRVRL